MMSTEQSFQLLGLTSGASKEQIKQAYHDLVKVWHPDRFAHDPRLQKQAEEKLKLINEAHDLLTGARVQTARPGTRPAQPASAAKPSRQPRPKDKYWMMPVISFIVLVIAVAVVSLIFYLYGREYDLVPTQKSAHDLM